MFVFCDCCVFGRWRCLRRAGHLFRGVLLSVCVCVCMCVCVPVCLIVCHVETSRVRQPRPVLYCYTTEKEFFFPDEQFVVTDFIQVELIVVCLEPFSFLFYHCS